MLPTQKKTFEKHRSVHLLHQQWAKTRSTLSNSWPHTYATVDNWLTQNATVYDLWTGAFMFNIVFTIPDCLRTSLIAKLNANC